MSQSKMSTGSVHTSGQRDEDDTHDMTLEQLIASLKMVEDGIQMDRLTKRNLEKDILRLTQHLAALEVGLLFKYAAREKVQDELDDAADTKESLDRSTDLAARFFMWPRELKKEKVKKRRHRRNLQYQQLQQQKLQQQHHQQLQQQQYRAPRGPLMKIKEENSPVNSPVGSKQVAYRKTNQKRK